MPRRQTPLVTSHYYHLYNRGNNRAPIFFESANYIFFLKKLREHVAGKDALIVAYALMPNHFHLLVQALTDRLSHAMQLLGISYTKAINKRFDRVGALFQGAFQAKQIDRDEYLLHLSRYIHLNPVRACLVENPQDWAYSSYSDYIGLRPGTLPRADIVLQQFRVKESTVDAIDSDCWLPPARKRYQEFVSSYSQADRAMIKHLLATKTSEVLKTSEVSEQ